MEDPIPGLLAPKSDTLTTQPPDPSSHILSIFLLDILKKGIYQIETSVLTNSNDIRYIINVQNAHHIRTIKPDRFTFTLNSSNTLIIIVYLRMCTELIKSEFISTNLNYNINTITFM